MSPKFNCSVSVDCVVFGFDGKQLKVLLIKRNEMEGTDFNNESKLPGSMIYEDESLSSAAYRVLEEMTGLRDVFLKQLHVFSEPDRIVGAELDWINQYYGMNTSRVITVAYYSLIKLNSKIEAHTKRKSAKWVEVQSIRLLGLDHKKIVMRALETLSIQLTQQPIAFELLPKKFTIRALQDLYEAIFGVEIDNRNFRKKILSSGYLTPTYERQEGVAHKPAMYYIFNKTLYQKEQKAKFKLNF